MGTLHDDLRSVGDAASAARIRFSLATVGFATFAVVRAPAVRPPATLRLRIALRPGVWKWRRVSATLPLAAGPERVILRLAPGGKAIVDDLVLRRLGA